MAYTEYPTYGTDVISEANIRKPEEIANIYKKIGDAELELSGFITSYTTFSNIKKISGIPYDTATGALVDPVTYNPPAVQALPPYAPKESLNAQSWYEEQWSGSNSWFSNDE